MLDVTMQTVRLFLHVLAARSGSPSAHLGRTRPAFGPSHQIRFVGIAALGAQRRPFAGRSRRAWGERGCPLSDRGTVSRDSFHG